MWSEQRIPSAVSLGLLDRNRYFCNQETLQLSSRGLLDPDPDSLLLRKAVSAGNPNRDLWICGQELWSQDHRDSDIIKKTQVQCTKRE
jgi:hypothetical protein